MAEQQEQPTRSSEGFEARIKDSDLGQTRSHLASFIEFVAESRICYSPRQAVKIIERLWNLAMDSAKLVGIDEVDRILREILDARDTTSEFE